MSLVGPRAAAGRLVQDSVGRPGSLREPLVRKDGVSGGEDQSWDLAVVSWARLLGSAGPGGGRPAVRPAPQRGWHTAASPTRNPGSDLLELSGSFTGGGSVVRWCPVSLAACRQLILFNYVTRVGLVGDSWGRRAGGGRRPCPAPAREEVPPPRSPWRQALSGQIPPFLDAGWPAASQDFPGPPVTAPWEGPPVRLGRGARLPRALASWLRLSACTSLSGDLTPVDC